VRFVLLLRILQPIVLAGIPAAAGGCVKAVIDTDCVDTVDRSFGFQTPADPPLQFRIESCRVDVEACHELCQLALERNRIDDVATRCKVSFDGDAVDVHVSYEVFSGGSNCPVEAVPPTALERRTGFQMRGLSTRTFDSQSHGGRTCHA